MFPQIIQETDYETIQFIESIYQGFDVFQDEIIVALEANKITFKSSSPEIFATVKVVSEAVYLNDASYTSPRIRTLVTTLTNVLHDCAEPIRMKRGQWPTRAYRVRTILEFLCNEEVLTIGSYSNGADDEERLYILDIESAQSSLFWSFP